MMIAALTQRPILVLVAVLILGEAVQAQTNTILKMFGKDTSAKPLSSESLELTEAEGPWLILASNFVGVGSRQRAERLANEIRQQLELPAYIYKEKFDFTGTIAQDPTSSKRLRYANRYQYDAYAVLVGEYDSVERPEVERDLKIIRTAMLPIFSDQNEVSAETNESNPVTTVKSITARLFGQSNTANGKIGPMSQAFVTRNPILPEEFFSAPKVDAFVHQMNEGLHHSLLDCDGRYTVVVKTFEGLGAIVDGRSDKKFTPSEERLNQYATKAEKMASELRSQGVEAYQFHDRYRSLVTIGSFEQLGRELPDGRFEYTPEIRAVMKKYSAFNVDPSIARQVPSGTRGIVGNGVAKIPYDVQPTPIAVPKLSKRSIYGAAFGMR
ncbi:MAG: hypothetical protein VYB72_04995 [Planctomycetota bacterium]|nr:hypothetical protein [Planctomycetota bacterium]